MTGTNASTNCLACSPSSYCDSLGLTAPAELCWRAWMLASTSGTDLTAAPVCGASYVLPARVFSAVFNSSSVTGNIILRQASPGSVTTVTISLQGLNAAYNTYSVHSLPAQNNCNVGPIYNPYGVGTAPAYASTEDYYMVRPSL